MGASYNDKFINIKNPISNVDIIQIEQDYGFTFPPEIPKHYLSYNGGTPEGSGAKKSLSDLYILILLL
ncbi:hypothetical protein COJ07_01165 [Bacillus cereus]|uniref:SMI1/KNR4 family protein n=1 Tax=Bacillus cereus TaxID=1396 RepID=UPI000BFA672E|nr:SMI1/KNR4 family protein [Bacillus cereus]PFL25316.1 hypothetical protein COJ07_01165 [Bacillus cereus]